ncbi:hypothetical protein DJ544_25270, partial [Enterobacter roggenkampii]|uniref:hypothetical protein n=2 Tax=Enterobacteriaceae TaxID=543 RepID=UPI0011E49853
DSLLINNARIALASLEAEPVCVIDQSNLDYLKSGSDADVWPASRAEMGDVLLYRSATPAPVSVPAAMEMDDDFDSAFEHGKAVGWNAYRAAMLQSFGNSEQLNSPVIPDGWVACSDRLPDPDSAFRVCAYTPTPHEDFRFRSVPASLFKSVCRDATHWQYMLPPAAPQQE